MPMPNCYSLSVNGKQKPPKYPELGLRLLITLGAIGAATAHVFMPKLVPDVVSGGLLVLAVLPWLSPLLKSVELTGLGKLEFRVEEVKAQQALLQEQVEGLRFLVSGFVTEWELDHLKKLEGGASFEYRRSLGHDDRFTGELIRLRDFGLIKTRDGQGVRHLPESGDLKRYIEITDRGRTYLRLRNSMAAAPQP